MDLKVALVLGGDPMSAQFSAIHTSPDVIVATPGRFLHLCVEMDLKLNSIGKLELKFIVFLLCTIQLHFFCRIRCLRWGWSTIRNGFRWAAERNIESFACFETNGHVFGYTSQTVGWLRSSWTRWSSFDSFRLVIRTVLAQVDKTKFNFFFCLTVDVESKLPDGLTLKFLHCRPDERYSALISLLKYVIPSEAQTVVFAGTQHHVELISYVSWNCFSDGCVTDTNFFVNFQDFDWSQN